MGAEAEEIAERVLGGGPFSVEKFVESFPALVDATGGIKRLRLLALKLALAGRLGTWHAADPPAIATDSSHDDVARPNWVRCTLPQLAEIEMGNSPPGTSYNDVGNGVPLINGPVEFSSGPLGLTQRTKFTTAPSRMCRKGDLLVCVRGATTGRTNVAAFDACIGRGVAMVRAKRFQPFINQFMWSIGADLLAAGTGTTFPAISRDDLAKLVVDVPPLAEQKRIVARVDQLMALIDQLEAKQNRKRDLGARFTKASLEALTTAESPQALTTAWTRIHSTWPTLLDHPDKLGEIRLVLLDLAVRGILVHQEEADGTAQPLVDECPARQEEIEKAGLFRTTERLPVPDEADCNLDVPSNWRWERLGNLCRFIDYRGKTPSKKADGIRLITAKNVRMGFVKTEPAEFISERDYPAWMTRGLPQNGDLLFTTEAPLGNVALFDFSERIALAQRIIALHPYCSLNSRFLMFVMMSPWFQALLLDKATGMTATGIKASKLKALAVPLAPLPEQKRIVAKVEHLMKLCDALEAALCRREDRAAKLAEAVVQEMVA